MSNWFKESKDTISTFIENFKGEEETPKNTASTATKTDETVDQYRTKLQGSQKPLSETVPMRKENSSSNGMTVNKSTNVKVMEPKNEDGAYVVVDEIRAGNIVLMKLDKAEGDAPATILNIVYGACHYANVCPEKVGPLMLLIDQVGS